MPLSDDISALKKAIDAETDPQKIIKHLENLRGLILSLPQENLEQRKQMADEYLYLGTLAHSLFTAKKIMVSYAVIAELYNQGLKLIPGVRSSLTAELINGMATARFRNGETTLAIQLFKDAIGIYEKLSLSDDRYGMVHANLANCYLSVKKYSEALENYELAERLCKEPKNKVLNVFNQVVTCCGNKNFDAVIVNFDRALKELETFYSDSKELPLVVYLKRQEVHAVRLQEAVFAYFSALLQANQYQRIIEFAASLLNDPNLCVYNDKFILECVADACVALEQFSAAIKYYDHALHDIQLPTEYSVRCSEKRIQCILAYGQRFYEQHDLPNALLQFQKVTSEVFFGEKNLEYKFLALKMSVDILIQQNDRDAAMEDYERASKIGEQLSKDNGLYKCDTALLHYKMVEFLKDEKKLEKYLLIHNLLKELSLNENTWPVFIDVTAKIGEISIKIKNYVAAVGKLGMILSHIPIDKKAQRVGVQKDLIYAFICLERFIEAFEEIDELLDFLGKDQPELKICLLVYKSYCLLKNKEHGLLKSDQPAAIEFTREAIDGLLVIDFLVIEAKILGWKILGDDCSSRKEYVAAGKYYQKAQDLLNSHKVAINIFDPKEITDSLNTTLKHTNIDSALENLLKTEDISERHKEIINLGLSILEDRLRKSEIGSFVSSIKLIDTALRKKAPEIAYELFEVAWERLQKTLFKGIELAPETYRELTSEEFKQVKQVQCILIDKQGEYRGEKRDVHSQRKEPIVTTPRDLLVKTGGYILANQRKVSLMGVPNLGGEKIIGYTKKVVNETKPDGTQAATISEEPNKIRYTPAKNAPITIIASVTNILSKLLTDNDTSILFDALSREVDAVDHEKKLAEMEKTQKKIYAAQQELQVTQTQIAADLVELREMLAQTKKRKREEVDEEETNKSVKTKYVSFS